MKRALETGRELPPNKMAFSSKNLVLLQRFLTIYEHNIQLQKQSLLAQNKKSRDYSEIVRKARLYLTHFVRVMNMAVYRGELPAETRAYFGLATNDSSVPSFNTENELLSWGKRIIEGEEFRIKKGGSPITNPTIAVVKVRFEHFIDALNYYQTINKKTLDYSRKIQDLRKEADDLILNIWNEVESFFANLPEKEKREKCENYGLVYFFRKGELQSDPSSEEIVIIKSDLTQSLPVSGRS
ncbi:MAG: hypothetical protein U0X39_15520 [Bacteroidales bacterium]